jgi:cytochrome c5
MTKLILASLLAFALTACGSSSNNDTQPTPAENTDANNSTDNTACTVDGTVVLGTTGASCTHGDMTLECKENGSATLNNGISSGSGLITINGTKYTCP